MFALTAPFQRTCTVPHVAHFVTTSEMCWATTFFSDAWAWAVFVSRADPPKYAELVLVVHPEEYVRLPALSGTDVQRIAHVDGLPAPSTARDRKQYERP